MSARNREILRITIPSIITNITVPLLGMVDVAIVGHIGNATFISAIALATMVFNLIYWNFGFLRAGTSGLTAQAYGAGKTDEALNVLVQGVFIAAAAALALIVLQKPIALLCKRLIRSSEETKALMLTYFHIRIWAAPATIGLYVIKGWFIGMQNASAPMWVATILNMVNIVFSILFVFVFDAGIAGIAWGTVLAQYSGLLLAAAFWIRKYGHLWNLIDIKDALDRSRLLRFFKVNADIFIRSLCLIAVFTFIPYISATLGERTLAANTLLLQFFTLTSYIMDGFAYAGESIVGKYTGAQQYDTVRSVVRSLLLWGVALATLFSVTYITGGDLILKILTNEPSVIEETQKYMFWTYIIPFAGFAAFIYDGIYIGAMASKAMRNVMIVATAAFFATYYLLVSRLGNNALWTAFIIFLVLRGMLMFMFQKKNVFIGSGSSVPQ